MTSRRALTEAQLAYVDRFGFFYEAYGFQRTIGRILGFMLIADPREQSLNDIAEALSAAKSSVSTGTRFLMQAGLVERAAVSGDRKVYYRARRGAWAKALRDRLASNDAYRNLAEEGLTVIAGDNDRARADLTEMAELYDYFGRETKAALDRWDERHG